MASTDRAEATRQMSLFALLLLLFTKMTYDHYRKLKRHRKIIKKKLFFKKDFKSSYNLNHFEYFGAHAKYIYIHCIAIQFYINSVILYFPNTSSHNF